MVKGNPSRFDFADLDGSDFALHPSGRLWEKLTSDVQNDELAEGCSPKGKSKHDIMNIALMANI